MPSKLLTRQGSFLSTIDGQSSRGIAARMGPEVVMDFYTYAVLCGYAYQIRAGTITTPLVGDVVITDTAAEMCWDAALLGCIIPVSFQVSTRLLTGTLHEYAIKSVATASSAGTAFVPLPLRSSGGQTLPSVITARVMPAGGVTVTAELATTTLRHWEHANPAAGATGALPTTNVVPAWEPRMPPVLVGERCIYAQVAATGTGPSYYAHWDVIAALAAVLL